MKRVGLIAGMLVLLFAVGSFAMRGGAESDAIPVLQTQVADLQTRVAALEGTAEATPAWGVSGRTFTGTGFVRTPTFGFGGGSLSFVLDCPDADHGSLVLVSKDTGETIAMTPTITLNVVRGIYVVDVQCAGDWTLTVEAK